jgi:hypothetical protein
MAKFLWGVYLRHDTAAPKRKAKAGSAVNARIYKTYDL